MYSVASKNLSRSQRPAVILLASTLVVGGREAMLDLVLGNPGERSFRPIVCCTYKPGPIGERLMERGIPVYHSLATNKFDFRIVSQLANIIEREKYQ